MLKNKYSKILSIKQYLYFKRYNFCYMIIVFLYKKCIYQTEIMRQKSTKIRHVIFHLNVINNRLVLKKKDIIMYIRKHRQSYNAGI